MDKWHPCTMRRWFGAKLQVGEAIQPSTSSLFQDLVHDCRHMPASIELSWRCVKICEPKTTASTQLGFDGWWETSDGDRVETSGSIARTGVAQPGTAVRYHSEAHACCSRGVQPPIRMASKSSGRRMMMTMTVTSTCGLGWRLRVRESESLRIRESGRFSRRT